MGPGEYEQMLHDAEVRLARLKSLYEQYFQGIEKLEPAIPRKELERVLEILRKTQPRNTALRFRTQMLIAKYGTYVTYWQRIARQIEEGTYRRDVARVQQRRAREQARAKREEREGPSSWEIDVDVDEVEDLKDFSFDESDVDAILGSLGGSGSGAPSTPAPSAAPPRRLSVFGSALPGRQSSPPEVSMPPAARVPQPASGAASNGAPPPRTAAATFAKPAAAVATFGKPSTATFAKPAAPSAGGPAPAASTAARPPSPPARPAAPPAPRPAPPAPARPASVDDAEMRRIYDRYVEARRRNNERVDNVRYEALAQSVQQMIPKLREKHGDRKIDFDVVVQNGKVGLKPKVG